MHRKADAFFVKRDAEGEIESVSRSADSIHAERVEAGAPELLLFGLRMGSDADFVRSDLDFVRVLEDVLELLIERGVIRFTDLPLAAQTKMTKRRKLRSGSESLDLLDNDELM